MCAGGHEALVHDGLADLRFQEGGIGHLRLCSSQQVSGPVQVCAAESDNVVCRFKLVQTRGGSGNKLCSQPLKSLNFGSGVTSAVIYFIPALDYEGFTKTGATLTVTGDVVADGATLYTATLSTNALTIAKKAL